MAEPIQVYDRRFDPRLVRKFEVARSYSEPRRVSLSEDEPEAYVEWGGPSQFDIDRFDERERVDEPYRLSGHYYEEAREWEDVFIIQDDNGINHLMRKVMAIAFRGQYGEQVVLRFNNSGLVYNESGPGFEEGDSIDFPITCPFQMYADFTHAIVLS